MPQSHDSAALCEPFNRVEHGETIHNRYCKCPLTSVHCRCIHLAPNTVLHTNCFLDSGTGSQQVGAL